MQNTRLLACTVLALAGVSRASTYVVDAANGPGTNFTDIPQAIVTAVAGDIIVVRPGSYSGFTLSEGLTIVGEAGVNIAPAVTISGVPAGEFAVLSRLKLRETNVLNCQGAVVIDRATIKAANAYYRPVMVTVSACADVRFHQCLIEGSNGIANNAAPDDGGHALSVDASRVELSSCELHGGTGADHQGCSPPIAGHGGNALQCSNSSRVHVALTSAFGGAGGTASGSCGPTDGAGGHGIYIAFSDVIVAGVPSCVIDGGLAGGITNYDGWGVFDAQGSLRYSGTTVQSISLCGICAGVVTVHAVPDDPTLEVLGDPQAGAVLTYRFHGVSPHRTSLQEGARPVVLNVGPAPIEILNDRLRVSPLVTIPALGQVDVATTISSKWSAGTVRIEQGREFDATTNALLARTNSIPIVVRR